MLDEKEGDEYRLWFLLDQFSTPLMLPFFFDEEDKTEVKAGADPDKDAAVLRPDVLDI